MQYISQYYQCHLSAVVNTNPSVCMTIVHLCVLQRQHFVSCYWSVSSPALHNHDPSLPYLDQYQLDQSQFSSLFNLLQQWTTHTHLHTLARSAFHLLDENGDGLVNFKEFVCGLGKSTLTLN